MEKSKWISVLKRLPKYDEEVLIVFGRDSSKVGIATLFIGPSGTGRWYADGGGHYLNVIKWQPLPSTK